MNQQVKATISELRQRNWENFCLTKCNYGVNPKATAGIINHLSRDPRPSRAGILTDEKGKKYAKDKQKARGFKNMFAKICMKPKRQKRPGHKMEDRRAARNDRDLAERQLNKEYMAQGGVIPHVTRVEFKSALAKMTLGKAYGRDGISTEMIVNLSKLNLDRLRNLVNDSIQTGKVPAAWKFGVLIPIPKPGKDATKIESYRPISLLSCIGKLADRVITNRFVHHMESQGILSSSQTGFRQNRGTEDVGMELVCDIHKGRAISWDQKRNGGGTSDMLVIPVDFEKAFDKLDQAKLIKLCRLKGIPWHITRWYWSYVRSRRYCVRVGADYSKSCAFHTGVPQGSICGPNIFNLYTTTLASELKIHEAAGVKHGSYADDFSLWMRLKNSLGNSPEERLEMLRPMQRALDTVDRWSRTWGVPLSKTKAGEAMLCWGNYERKDTTDLELYLGGERLRFVEETKVLGVTMDDRLLFNKHLADIRVKAKRRMKAIAATTGKTWGGKTATIRTAYLSHVRSAVSHGAAVWYPLLSDRKKDQVERIQNAAARMITGCWTRANTTDILLEANLPPLAVHIETSMMRTVERARHRGQTESFTQMALTMQPAIKDRIVCEESWQQLSDNVQARCNVEAPRKELIEGVLVNLGQGAIGNNTAYRANKAILLSHPEANRVIIKTREDITSHTNRIAPHEAIDYGTSRIKFYDDLCETVSKKDPVDRQLAVARATLARLRIAGVNCEMWTDGTVASTRRGLGIAQFYSDTNDASDREWETKMSSGTCSSPYSAELCGVTAGLSEVLSRQRTPGRNLAIYTDCKSLVTGLSSGPLQQSSIREAHIWKMLYRVIREGYANRVVFQWVPGHCGLVRNEKADRNAKRHADIIQRTDLDYHARTPSSYKSITAYYKEKLAQNWKEGVPTITHRGVIAGAQFTKLKATDLKREDEVVLAQLRTGYCKLLGTGLAFATTGEFTEIQCRWCNRREENVPHLFEGHCIDPRIQQHRAAYAARHNTQITSKHLHTHPTQALEFFRGILATL